MNFNEQLQRKIDLKTKPLGALGFLENIAFKIASIQQTLSPKLIAPHLIVFAADHGITNEGVSAYPAEVTPQMVLNFLNGGAAINVFCKQNDITIKIVDAGVNYDFRPHPHLIINKAGYGTANMLFEPALSQQQLSFCISTATKLITNIATSGCNVIGFGEMGIGNTSASSLIISKLLQLPIEKLVGKGTGVSAEQLQQKTLVLQQVLAQHENISDNPLDILCVFGGFEIAQMYAAMVAAYQNNMIILIDGFIATAAFLVAYFENPKIISHAIFCHQSDEQAHKMVLDYLNEIPLLQLNLRVGEGTGCALAYPIIQSAVNFLNEMASFEDANVSNKS